MRLPVPPQARLPPGLLLLTLLLVTVCGVPLKEPPSPRVLFRKRPTMIEGKEATGAAEQPEGTARPASTLVSPGSLNVGGTSRPAFLDAREGSHILEDDEEALSSAEHRDLEHGGYMHEEDQESDGDRCDRWLSSSNHFFVQYLKLTLQNLPSCPCKYPDEALGGVATLFDQHLNYTFSWKDASDAEEYVVAFHPSAHRCLRSLRMENSRTLGAQLCCYDHHHRLLTRGKGAGSPELVSPYVSSDLHFTLNRFPRVFCKGDWSRYHRMLPPNNDLSCPQRPSKNKYTAQLLELASS